MHTPAAHGESGIRESAQLSLKWSRLPQLPRWLVGAPVALPTALGVLFIPIEETACPISHSVFNITQRVQPLGPFHFCDRSAGSQKVDHVTTGLEEGVIRHTRVRPYDAALAPALPSSLAAPSSATLVIPATQRARRTEQTHMQ